MHLNCVSCAWSLPELCCSHTCIWLCIHIDPALSFPAWAQPWLSDLNCWPALLVLFGYCGTCLLSVSCSLCLLVTLSPWLTVPFRAAVPLLLPNTQLRFHIYTAADSGAVLVRACFGVCACHCSSLNKPACSLRACLGISSTMIALCNVVLTSLPSVSKFLCSHSFPHQTVHHICKHNFVVDDTRKSAWNEKNTFWLQLDECCGCLRHLRSLHSIYRVPHPVMWSNFSLTELY